MFGDQTIAAAMIDRLVHHAEVHTLTGDSYRTKNRASTPWQAINPKIRHNKTTKWSTFQRAKLAYFWKSVDRSVR